MEFSMLNSNYWVVTDIKLYSNLDCTGTNDNDGTPVSSEYYDNDSPENAFDTNDSSWWQGIYNNNNPYWVGMEYDNAREALCLS